ncbi:MAG: lysophospholipid acyltransferase family protein [Phototrophicales bacterium]
MAKNILINILRLPILAIWRLMGWRAIGDVPPYDKFVLTAAPHTSNWDYIIMLGLAAHYKRRPKTIVKDKLLKWFIIGRFIRWFGGVPVARSHSENTIQQVVQWFDQHEKMILVLAPEGTRKKVPYWRSGFYYMAYEAGVPIVLGFLDYKNKQAGFGEVIHPSGDIHADMERIRAFYQQHGYGKYPENASDVRLKDEL